MVGMSAANAHLADWTVVDEGWGRKALDFSTLSEPTNCREFVALDHKDALRAEIKVRGLTSSPNGRNGLKMTGSFLGELAITPQIQSLYDEDLTETGYVWNVSRLWAYQPETVNRLFELMSQAFKPSGLTFRQRGILVTAAASTLGDSYCSMAWGGKLAGVTEPDLAAGVLKGRDDELSGQEKAMAAWARKVVKDPNATTPADVEALRDAGLNDDQIFAITAFVALRLAFSTINDALGAQPDAQLIEGLPKEVVDAVTYGRRPAPPEGACN
jgi:uncharacterized peroxidase-related enzyme